MYKNLIVPTGYMGSGSSAVTDVLSEIETFNTFNGSEEYVFLHCPDGLFDLEDKLLVGNNALRSDEAIHRFYVCMKNLFDLHNYWPGKYKERLSPNFMRFVNEFLAELVIAEIDDVYWYFQEQPINNRMQIKLIVEKALKRLLKSHLKCNPPLLYSQMKIAFPEKEEFYSSSKKLIQRVLADIENNESNLVLDQLLLPHNLYRMGRYFGSEMRAIVVDRDPRDVFLLNKYVWNQRKRDLIPYPLDVECFCNYYRKMRKNEKIVDSQSIVRIHFEDLVYHYSETLEILYSFLEVDGRLHKNKGMVFSPLKSMNNTQIFLTNVDYKEEASYIEKELSEFLYDFPCDISNIERNVKNIF